jgi:hypothetical protein
MVKQGHGGSVIGISSVSALLGGGLQTHYTPTKAAILSKMQSIAICLGKDKIRCKTIATQLADHGMKNPTKKAALDARIPLGRIGDPEDMAGPAVFLACEEMSRYVNATGVLADGGMHSNCSSRVELLPWFHFCVCSNRLKIEFIGVIPSSIQSSNLHVSIKTSSYFSLHYSLLRSTVRAEGQRPSALL